MIRNIYIVCGFHRSGTSLIASLIKNFGISCHEKEFHQPNKFNKNGYYEDDRIINLHEKIFKDHNLNWWDPNLKKIIYKKHNIYLNEIKKFLLSIKNEKNFFIKDPRIILFYELWQKATKSLNIRLNPIFIIRDPIDCAKSIEYRDGLDLNHVLYLWTVYHSNIQTIKDLRSKSYFIVYNELIKNSKKKVNNFAKYISKNESIKISEKKILKAANKIKIKINTNTNTIQSKEKRIALDLFKKIKKNDIKVSKLKKLKNYKIQINNNLYLSKLITLNRKLVLSNDKINLLNKNLRFQIKKIRLYESNIIIKSVKWFFKKLKLKFKI